MYIICYKDELVFCKFKHFFKEIFVILCLMIFFTENTVDITYSQFQYLSTHLAAFECKRLVAALHYRTFQLNPIALDAAEELVPDELNCLDLLLEWNSAENEGRGQTHEIVALRLRQLGHPELASWLSHIVYKKLEKEMVIETTVNLQKTTNETNASVLESEEDVWSLLITIEHIFLMTVFIVTFQKVCVYILLRCFTSKKSKTEVAAKEKSNVKGYENERRLSEESKSLLSQENAEFLSEDETLVTNLNTLDIL